MNAIDLPANEIPALSGNNAPVRREIVAHDMPVIGEIPRDLNGMYVRNGPNAHYQPDWRYHAYDGDGMLHAVQFERGKAVYRNKWVRTAALEEEVAAGRPLWKGLKEPARRDRPDQPFKNTANTDVKFHNGKLVAMWYRAGQPYHVDPVTLETIGPATFGGAIHSISAHSRPDEHTGEFLFFDYGEEAPFMEYGVVGADGALKHRTEIPLAGPRLPHDMAVTPNWTILHDFPLFLDEGARLAGRHKVAFHDLPTRFALIPRHGSARDIRWFTASPGYMLHVVNAWEEGDEVVMVGTPYRMHHRADGQPDGDRLCRTIRKRQRDFLLYRWRFDMKTGVTREEVIDDVLNSEFPVINSAFQGLKNRYSYNVVFPQGGEEEPRFPALVKYNIETGGWRGISEGPDWFYNEPGFAPRDNATAEDDGYLVTFAWNPVERRSEVHIFDCADREFARGPVARIVLPQRVPNGFHATYVSAARLASGR